MTRNRNWIWFFVALAVLAVVVIMLLGLARDYVSQQRLTSEQLEEGRLLWGKGGAEGYELKYTVQRGPGEKLEKYEVRVRGGKAEYVSRNDKALVLEPGQEVYYGMPALFNYLWDYLNLDSNPKSTAAFSRAAFDPADGH